MLEQVVRLSVEMTIHDGAFEAFEAVILAMTAGSESEPGTLGYEWFFSVDRKHCRLLEIYTDGPALLAHFTGPVVTDLVPKMVQFCTIDRFEIYGDPGPQAAAIGASLGAQFFTYRTGLSR